MILILFIALASGGAVVISQYIGRKAMDDAGESASQLLLLFVIFSALVSALVMTGNEGMLRLMFEKVESDVMQACVTYLRISAYSYPALAVYNAGAALFRSMGKTSVTMYLSAASNIINVIGNLIGVFVLHAGVAMGPVFITIIGQCMGKRDKQATEFYFQKLTKITLLISSIWNLLIFLLTPLFMKFYALEPDTKQLVIWLVLIHNLFNAIAYPFSGALSNGLRAAGDVKFTMYVSVISTIAVRLLLSWFLGVVLRMGVIGIAAAMVGDWVIRAVIFFRRQKSGKWKTFQVI